MIDYSVVKRYARALFNIAVEENLVDEIGADCQSLLHLLEEKREVLNLLLQPQVSDREKKEFIIRIIGARIPPALLNTINYAIDQNRVGLLKEILRFYALFRDQYRGVEDITIRTAIPLDDDTLKDIIAGTQRFTPYELRPKVLLDPLLVGGVLVTLGKNRVLDGSIRTFLDTMKSALLEKREG